VDVIGKFCQMGWQLSAKTWIAMAQEDLGWQASKPLDYTRANSITVFGDLGKYRKPTHKKI